MWYIIYNIYRGIYNIYISSNFYICYAEVYLLGLFGGMRYHFTAPFVQYLRAFLPHRRYLKFALKHPTKNFLPSIASYLVKMKQKCGKMMQLTAPKDLTGGSSSQLLLPIICSLLLSSFCSPPGERYDPNIRSGARWQIKKLFKILDKSSSNMV